MSQISPVCVVCSPSPRLRGLGNEQFRCPKCSRLYDFTEETCAPHNNPAIAAEMNETRRFRDRNSYQGQIRHPASQRFLQHGGK